jgi:Glutaredoxin-like domain (DUF836)
VSPSPVHLQLLSRKQCCLCDDARQAVADVARQGLCTWETLDVDRDKALLVRYGNDVPVLLMDGEKLFEHRVPAEELRRVLEAAAC